jgi:hypothetical protein
MTEMFALVAFSALIALLVSRIRREQRQQIVSGDRSAARRATPASIVASSDLAAGLATPPNTATAQPSSLNRVDARA